MGLRSSDQRYNITRSPFNMKFTICIAALALMATIEAAPATETGEYGSDTPNDGSKYFAATLDGIQGALDDISAAGTDLTTIEPNLRILLMAPKTSTTLKLPLKLLLTALLTPTLGIHSRPQ